MDRTIVYPGSIPLDTDLLNTNRNSMVAIGALIAATLGTNTVVDGLAVSPTVPASLGISVGAGSIVQLATVDQNAYGSLPADTADGLMKMGVNLAGTAFTLTAPTSSGQSITYLIEAALSEADVNPVVLPYYNAANPAQPYLGPNNSGASQSTARIQRVQLLLKAGAPANTGSQSTPPVDAGWVGLATITVGYGQTQVTAQNIAVPASAPMLSWKLPSLRPGYAALQAFTASGVFVIPAGVTRAKVTVIGAGGAGGTHATLPGGGGGAGAQAVKIVTGLSPGQTIAVTVGASGASPSTASPSAGGSGGTSSFGPIVSATGGLGGGGGTAAATNTGGAGGLAFGGDINSGGSSGTDALASAARGGDGGGPGAGRGGTGQTSGVTAGGYGGGGGGGGASQPNGAGSGSQGGSGGPGLVIVEF